MIIGVPKEIKDSEYRVAMVPAGVEILTKAGHTVLMEAGAGRGTGIADEEYAQAGARILPDAKSVWAEAEMVVKVKEPLPQEYPLIRRGQVIFTYFHFAADEGLTRAMMDSGAVCIAYETLQMDDGSLPLLIPMSEIAGRMAIQEGAKYLERPMEGRGILLSGVPGVRPAHVVVLGGGVAGTNAAKIAAGIGANVTVLDINTARLRVLEDILPKNVDTLMSNAYNIREELRRADLVIGAALRPGARAPILITREMLSLMKPGAVIVDISIDQGGIAETSRPTTHSQPVYTVDGIIHYCVTNMPGAVPGTSTYALTNETTRWVLEIANHGWRESARLHAPLRHALNVVEGKVTYEAIAELFGLPYTPPEALL
ncbi:MAG: alanine dehydrogenase [Chthonomonadetes bacterium]|nr:alanine dehydrogenase [Chthonomonadetes bacterium]